MRHEARVKLTDGRLNLDIVNRDDCAGPFGMPTLEPCHADESRFIGFNEAKSSTKRDLGVHFFIDDYQFERVWRNPLAYIQMLSDYTCVLTPDFSLYADMPLPLMLMSVYKSRFCGHLWQRYGMDVVPTLQWCGPETYDFCFTGIPKGATVAVSTVGVMRSKAAQVTWRKGMDEALLRLEPERVILYGKPIEFDTDAEVVNVAAYRFRKRGK